MQSNDKLKTFARGTRVIYKKDPKKLEIATIVASHLDELPDFVYYTIELKNGHERQTQDKYLEELKPIKLEKEDPPPVKLEKEDPPPVKVEVPSEEKNKITSFVRREKVLYTNKETNNTETVTIVGVHLDNLPDFIYYTIKLEGGREKQTRDMYLKTPTKVIFWKNSKKLHTVIKKIEGSKYTLLNTDDEKNPHCYACHHVGSGDIKTGIENLLFIADRISKPVANAVVKFNNPTNFKPTQNQIDAISHCAKIRNMRVVDVGFELESQYNAVAYSLRKLPNVSSRNYLPERIKGGIVRAASATRVYHHIIGHRIYDISPNLDEETYLKNPEDWYSYNSSDRRWGEYLVSPKTSGMEAGDGWPGAATLYAIANHYNCIINVLTDYGEKNNVISIIPASLRVKNNWRNEWAGPYSGGGISGSKHEMPKKPIPQKRPEEPVPGWNEIWIAYLDRHHYMALEPMSQSEVKGGKSKKLSKRSRKTRKNKKSRKVKMTHKKSKRKRTRKRRGHTLK